MPWWVLLLLPAGVWVVFAFIHFLGKNKRPFRRALVSMLIGAGLLTAINLTSGFTGVSIPVSFLSVAVSVIGGLPGVTLLLLLNLFF